MVNPRMHIFVKLGGHVVNPRTDILTKSSDQPEMHIHQFPSQDLGRYNQPFSETYQEIPRFLEIHFHKSIFQILSQLSKKSFRK